MTPWRRLLFLLLFPACLYAQGEFRIHGYIQGRFTDQKGTPDRLEIRRARVLLSGEPVSKLSYALQFDLLKRPYVMDSALAWSFSGLLRVTGGQFKIPFSSESLTSDNLEVAIARSRAVNTLAPGRDTGVQGRDVGLQLDGVLSRSNSKFVEYAAGVFRGQTLVYAPNAHFRGAAARALLHPFRGVTIGGDWYGSFSVVNGAPKRRWDAEALYERGPFRFSAEQLWARDGTLERRGGYTLGSWRASQYWEPLARLDWFTSNIHKASSTSVAYLGGLNFYWGKHVKLATNMGAQLDQGSPGASRIVLGQAMLGF